MPAHAQEGVPNRQIRTFIPPDELVSFLPSTSFDQFVEFLNPIFERVTGKAIVDPEARSQPIGVSVAGMHFMDAFELVLEYNDLWYRETPQFFIVEVAPDEPQVFVQEEGPLRQQPGVGRVLSPATLDTREIQINAILFELNHSRARDVGIDWNTFFGTGGGSGGNDSGGGTNGGAGGSDDEGGTFIIRTDDFFAQFNDFLISPDAISITTLTQFFRLLETEGLGETIASPQVTVLSGQKGEIQIGSDIPFLTRDFAGNTRTEFIKTGIIIDVVPTLIEEPIVDTLNAPTLEFIHLNVSVENSSSRPSGSGLAIDRNRANTQVLLLDEEQTIIGGLYSTQESVSRRGIPFLKDLPPWVFGLRYVFGYTQRQVTQKELLIVLQARLLDTIEARADRPFRRNMIQQKRREVEEDLQRLDDIMQPQVEVPRATRNR